MGQHVEIGTQNKNTQHILLTWGCSSRCACYTSHIRIAMWAPYPNLWYMPWVIPKIRHDNSMSVTTWPSLHALKGGSAPVLSAPAQLVQLGPLALSQGPGRAPAAGKRCEASLSPWSWRQQIAGNHCKTPQAWLIWASEMGEASPAKTEIQLTTKKKR